MGRLVSQCIRAGETLDTLSHQGLQGRIQGLDEDVYQALELRTCVNGRKVCGGPAADSVRGADRTYQGIRGDTQTWISRRSLSTAGGHHWPSALGAALPADDLELLRIGEARRQGPGGAEKIPQRGRPGVSLPARCRRLGRRWSSLKNGHTRIIDASTAHRTASGWVYGFPELYKDPERITTGPSGG